MPRETICPFLLEEIYKDSVPVGIRCKRAEIIFADRRIRRGFVYPLCGSMGNYKGCVLYKRLEKKNT